MTAEQLKGSILQLAMQGKLVEQRTNEREVVFKKGKGKETEEIDFEIPMSWKTAHLETVVDSVASKQYQIKESEVKAEGKYRVISQSKEYSIGYCNDNSKLYHHTQPVIVFGDHTTEVKFIDFDFVVGADGIKIFNPNTDIIEPRFLFYQLQFYTRGLNKVGGYSRHYKFIKNKPVVIPPHAEQKRIVAKIEELMPFVDQYADVSTKLNTLNATFPDQMKKSILQQAVMGKLVPQNPDDEPAGVLLKKIAEEKKRLIKEGKIKKQKPLPKITEDEIPFDIPESWEWARWGAISESIQYGYNAPAKASGRIKMVRISDIQNNSVMWETVPFCDIKEADIPDYLLKENDILFARTGGTVGKSFLVQEVNEDAIYAGYLIRTRYSQNLCPEYLKYFMESDLYWRQLRNGTIATAQPNCNGQTLSKMIIPIPPLKEQYRIVEKVKSLSVHIHNLEL